jgi:hypothetical protein
MALTCTIYENNLNLKIKNNFKSEVMKSNNQKQKKHSSYNMYNYFVHAITCTKSQLVHDI